MKGQNLLETSSLEQNYMSRKILFTSFESCLACHHFHLKPNCDPVSRNLEIVWDAVADILSSRFHSHFFAVTAPNWFIVLCKYLLKRSTNNNELYLHGHASTHSIAKAMFRNQNYNTGQLRHFDNNLSRTLKQAERYFMNCILIT